MRYLGEDEVEEFTNALPKQFNFGSVGGVEEVWGTFKKVWVRCRVACHLLQEAKKVTE